MKLRVLRDKGLPVDAPIYAFGETFESGDERGARWVEQGYAEHVSGLTAAIPAADSSFTSTVDPALDTFVGEAVKKERPRRNEPAQHPLIESPEPKE